MSIAPTVSARSTITEVCEWASREATQGGVGLSSRNVSILRREEIEGTVLFTLTDAELKESGMSLGARKKLLNAITILQEPQGELIQPCDLSASQIIGAMCSLSATRGAVQG